MSEHYCAKCSERRKVRTDGTRHFCAVCGKQTPLDKMMRAIYD